MILNFKKYLSLLILLVTVGTFAQVRYGAKLGLGRTNYRNIHIDSKPRYGINFGAVALIPFQRYDFKNFVQAELNYVSHGEKNGSVKRHVNYIALPIMYKRYLTEKEKNDLYLEIGPQFAYAVSNDFDKYEIAPLNDNKYDNSDNNQLRKFDLSIGIGGGISIERKYEIGLRYNYGIIDSFKPKYTNFDNGMNNSSLLTLSFTYLFGDY